MKKIVLGTLVALVCVGSVASAEARNRYTGGSYSPAPDYHHRYWHHRHGWVRGLPTGAGHNKYTTSGH